MVHSSCHCYFEFVQRNGEFIGSSQNNRFLTTELCYLIWINQEMGQGYLYSIDMQHTILGLRIISWNEHKGYQIFKNMKTWEKDSIKKKEQTFRV